MADRSVRYLWFQRAGNRFAVPMTHLQRVLPVSTLRSLPAAEPALAGFTLLDGKGLPVLDPSCFADLTPTACLFPAIVVVLVLEGQPVFGLLAEQIGKVVELPSLSRVRSELPHPQRFCGEISGPGKVRTLVVDVPALAKEMGLTTSQFSESEQVISLPAKRAQLKAENL